jgi:hypothetical protein
MNLRKITLKYMGWCPGIEAAARFIPDKDIPNKITVASMLLSLTILISIGLAAQIFATRPEGPLKVRVDGEVFYDGDFDEDFDYSMLINKTIYFYEKVTRDDFAGSWLEKDEAMHFKANNLRDVWSIIDDIEMPHIVRGVAKLVCNGTYEEVDSIFHEPWGLGIGLGDYWGWKNRGGSRYWIYRTPESDDDVETFELLKVHYTPGEHLIWRLEVRIYQPPPLEVTFRRATMPEPKRG